MYCTSSWIKALDLSLAAGFLLEDSCYLGSRGSYRTAVWTYIVIIHIMAWLYIYIHMYSINLCMLLFTVWWSYFRTVISYLEPPSERWSQLEFYVLSKHWKKGSQIESQSAQTKFKWIRNGVSRWEVKAWKLNLVHNSSFLRWVWSSSMIFLMTSKPTSIGWGARAATAGLAVRFRSSFRSIGMVARQVETGWSEMERKTVAKHMGKTGWKWWEWCWWCRSIVADVIFMLILEISNNAQR